MFSSINRGAARLVATVIGFLGTIIFLSSGHLIGFVLVFAAPYLVIVIHEFGHAIAAWATGMHVIEISAGPFALRTRPLRFGMSETFLGRNVGGPVLHNESRGRYLTRAADRWIIASGPLANLVTFAVCYGVGRLAGNSPEIRLLIGFGLASLAAFVLSAWPHRLNSGRGNDASEFIRTFDARSPFKSKRPARSPWQAP